MSQSKVFALLLGMLIMGSLFVAPSFAVTDINGARYQEAITDLLQNGIVGGYADGTFQPNATINRAEFVKIAIGSITKNYGSDANCFLDVRTEWFAPFVCYAKTQGIISGYADGTFRPGQTITLVEALKIISETEKISLPTVQASDAWYVRYLTVGLDQQFVPEDVTKLDAPLTRQQMAEMIYRVRLLKDNASKYQQYLAGLHATKRTIGDFSVASSSSLTPNHSTTSTQNPTGMPIQTVPPISASAPSPSPTTSSGVFGNQKILVLLVNFLDSGATPFTREQANDIFFNGQAQKFFQEQSYGKMYLSGDVYGWYAVQKNAPLNIPGQGVDCTGGIGSTDYDQLMKENNINLGSYQHLFIVMNGKFFTGCESQIATNGAISVGYISAGPDYAGLAVRTRDSQWLPSPFAWSTMDSTITHELGHGFGLPHANGWVCDDQIFSADCQDYEYGNPFDDMGMRGDALHFNAYYKERLGWIDSTSELVIAQSGRYTINNLEAPQGIHLAKIKLGEDEYFYLEYRRGIGFDSFLNFSEVSSNQDGLLINYVFSNQSHMIHEGLINNQSHLLDMTPGPITWTGDWITNTYHSSLNGDNTFFDSQHNLTIGPIIRNDANSITFDVAINQAI